MSNTIRISTTGGLSVSNRSVQGPSEELSIQERSEQPFYFVVRYVEPVMANAAVIHLDLYSSSKCHVSIKSALETWMPALTDCLRLVQESDESAYSVLLVHPGIPLESAPEVKPRDRSLMVLRRMEWRRMLSSE
jgi:CHASE1-domain containing sensor protein